MKKDLVLRAAKETLSAVSTTVSKTAAAKNAQKEAAENKKTMFSLKCNAYYDKLGKEEAKKVGCLSLAKKPSCC